MNRIRATVAYCKELFKRFVNKVASLRRKDTLRYIVRKFNVNANGKSPIEIPDTDRQTLAHLFKELGFKNGVEVGVEEGIYAEVLCKANPGLKLHCVDSWKAYEGYLEHRDQTKIDSLYEKAKERLQKYNVHLIKKLSIDGVKDFPDNSLDFVYIDGNHKYDYALKDITEWTKKVRPGGIVSGHDFRRDKSGLIQVVEALSKYAEIHGITFFVFGRKNKLSDDEKRDKHRSWMFIRALPAKDGMLGKWDGWYRHVKRSGSFRYGDTITYGLAADFLSDMPAVEDWGCGTGGFKRLYKGKYVGIDGSANPYVDKVADLCEYRSHVEGIMMRHVLEHNYDWRKVLTGAVESFDKKFCLVIFTPFVETTKEIAHNKKHGVDVPDIAFAREDIEGYLTGSKWRMESHQTKTGYGIEHIYFIEKP